MSSARGRSRPILLASRTRKARRPSNCVLCGAPVTIGQRIGLLVTGWAHVLCIVQANRTPPPTMTAMTTEE